MASAAVAKSRGPLFLTQFVERLQCENDLLAILRIRFHLLKFADQFDILWPQFSGQFVHLLIQLIGLTVRFSLLNLITDFYKIAIGLCFGRVAADYFDDLMRLLLQFSNASLLRLRENGGVQR